MENKNEIIEAEEREIESCDLPTITAEIKYISKSMNNMLLQCLIEIGKRFAKAKTLVQYGKWGEYCEKYTGYKQAMAENYIKIYKEYGADQQSLFGNFENSESIKNLGVTKLIELTAIPADEREHFVEENNITEETTVKQLHKLIQEKTDALDRAEKKQAVAEKKLEEQIKQSEQAAKDKQLMIERLQAELDIRNAEPATVPQDELEKMMQEADEKAKKSLQAEIDKLKTEKKKAEQAAEKAERAAKKSKQKAKNAEQQYKELQDDVSSEKEKTAAAEKENEELKKTIEKLQKESLLGSNEKMVKLQMCFEQAQSSIIAVKTALAAVEGSEKYDKLFAAVKETLKGKVEEI
jgi:chromosome segregation ATPase